MLYTWNLLNIVNQLCQSKKKNSDGEKKGNGAGRTEKNEVGWIVTSHFIKNINSEWTKGIHLRAT